MVIPRYQSLLVSLLSVAFSQSRVRCDATPSLSSLSLSGKYLSDIGTVITIEAAEYIFNKLQQEFPNSIESSCRFCVDNVNNVKLYFRIFSIKIKGEGKSVKCEGLAWSVKTTKLMVEIGLELLNGLKPTVT